MTGQKTSSQVLFFSLFSLFSNVSNERSDQPKVWNRSRLALQLVEFLRWMLGVVSVGELIKS